MVRFAHIADCHLGSWRQPELRELNFESFKKAIRMIIEEKVDFVLISGDLFDSAYPPIEILKDTFSEFKKLKDAKIPAYLIAGSHDYSASGRTFLDVLEKAGFCENVEKVQTNEEGKQTLLPTFHENIAIYGYSGKKSSMEIEELKNTSIKREANNSILMLHTTISDVISNIDMNSIEKENLPDSDYYAFGHIHQRFEKEENNKNYIYPGPTFPNNFQELIDLKQGSIQITEIGQKTTTKNIKIPSKEVVFLEIELENALTATQEIIEKIDKQYLKDKVLLLRLKGTLHTGKSGDIRFNEIEEFVKKKEVYAYLRNISQLRTKESEISLKENQLEDVEEIENTIQKEFSKENPNQFNEQLPSLMNILSMEKTEEEKNTTFEERLLSEIKDALRLSEML